MKNEISVRKKHRRGSPWPGDNRRITSNQPQVSFNSFYFLSVYNFYSRTSPIILFSEIQSSITFRLFYFITYIMPLSKKEMSRFLAKIRNISYLAYYIQISVTLVWKVSSHLRIESIL